MTYDIMPWHVKVRRDSSIALVIQAERKRVMEICGFFLQLFNLEIYMEVDERLSFCLEQVSFFIYQTQ